MSKPKSRDGRQISIAGVLAYAALWAVIICLFREVVRLQQGVHSIAAARLSEVLTLLATGMLFAAIGLPIAIAIGKGRHAAPIAFGCFVAGVVAIPILIAILVTLSGFGIVDLD